MPRLRILGSYDPVQSRADKEALKTATLTVREIRSYRIEAARGAKAPEEITPEPDDIIELELEEGFRFWVRSDEIHTYFPPSQGRGVGDETIEITSTIACDTPSRGLLGKLVLKALRLIKIDPAEASAKTIGVLLENKLSHSGTGLFRLPPDSFALQPCGSIPTNRPILLFIHGTFSSTEGSFGHLWEAERVAERATLFKTYDNQVFGFDHRSVTEDPITNACALVDALPAGARLHVVSHSRGGMVGELLCRGALVDGRSPFAPEDRAVLNGQEDQTAMLDKLSGLLRKKKIYVERFVRVACPTRGTTLASQRMDRWFSVIVNLLGKVPVFKASGVYDVLTEFMLAVVKEHSDPKTMPGLAAMMPDSPCVAILNRPGVTVKGELRVIAGDIEESGIWGKLKLLFTDWFYGGEHDLVVNTASMWGGARRLDGRERAFFHQGPQVTHFRYFVNAETAQKLVAALIAKEGDDDGFAPDVRRVSEPIARSVRKRAPTGTRPIVFVLPGIMGSHLAVGDDRVWLDPLDLAAGGFTKLAINTPGVQAESPFIHYYGGLMNFLEDSYEVWPFPFDWRQTIAQEARRLGDQIESALNLAESHGQPVRIIAHSMGGIVARVMFAARPQVFKRMCAHTGSRFVMLGTPNGGAFATVRTLMAQEPYIKYLAKLDLKSGHDTRFLLKIIAEFPGLLSLLPIAADRDYYNQTTWKELAQIDKDAKAWVIPNQQVLDVARTTWQLLQNSPVDPERMIYVAGVDPSTPCGLEVVKDDDGNDSIQSIASSKGDGRVPWDTGILKGIRTWYMEVSHGELSCYEPAFDALGELLEQGTTQRLASVPPVARGVRERFPLPHEEALLYPDSQDLAAAALGAGPSRRTQKRPAPQAVLKVTVTHGNMAYTEAAVAVGHYQDDVIISAEAYLDRRLGGRLRDRYRLGVYPGAYDTCEVFLNPGKKPGGAIIVGLGAVGSLTAGKLEDAFAHAALKYALAIAEAKDNQACLPVSGHIAAVLIGTGGHALTVSEAVTAIVRGVLKANETLSADAYARCIKFEKLELIEIYEDRAIQAMRALAHLGQDPTLQGKIVPDAMLRILDSGLRRASYEEDPGWWHRIQITETDQGEIKYLVLTNRARAEDQLRPTQRPLIDALVKEAATLHADDADLGNTLFELLIPNELKDATPEMSNVMFVLDKATARYPWELLRDRSVMNNAPLVTRAQFIRQYATERYRRQVTMTRKRTALVIGDPLSTKYPELTGAQAEAKKVGQRLQDAGFEAPCLIQQDYRTILDALFAREYRILHLAAHGVYEYEVEGGRDKSGRTRKQLVTGMVLGDDTFLTPVEINQMRVVPELVFINCCLLGKVGQAELRGDRSALAANLATQLIEMGVRAVVAAGWEVDDEAALCFADVFYGQMLAGRTFSEALLEARQQTFNTTKTNTWGAYQAYGDPDYTLCEDQGLEAKTSAAQRYLAPAQPIIDLKNIVAEAKNADVPQKEGLKVRLETIAQGLPRAWLDMADFRVALAEAYGELKCFAEAVSHYQAALACPSGNVPMRAIEQLCNLQVRLIANAPAKDTAQAIAEIKVVKSHIENLIALCPSSERYAILGSACKRLSRLSSGKARLASLKEMTGAYKSAADLAFSISGQAHPYAAQNWIAGEILLHLIDPHVKGPALGTLKAELKKTQQAARQGQQESPDFWNLIIPIDCELLLHMLALDLAKQVDTIADAYREAIKQAGSPRELDSATDQVKFLVEMLKEKKSDKRVAGVIKGLETIRKATGVAPGKVRTRKK